MGRSVAAPRMCCRQGSTLAGTVLTDRGSDNKPCTNSSSPGTEAETSRRARPAPGLDRTVGPAPHRLKRGRRLSGAASARGPPRVRRHSSGYTRDDPARLPAGPPPCYRQERQRLYPAGASFPVEMELRVRSCRFRCAASMWNEPPCSPSVSTPSRRLFRVRQSGSDNRYPDVQAEASDRRHRSEITDPDILKAR